MLTTTAGQLLINDVLPSELRDYSRVLDKKQLHTLLQQVAKKHPEQYRDVSFKLNQIGQRVAQDQGGLSFGLRHLRRSKVADQIREKIQGELQQVLNDDSLTDQQRTDRIVRVVGRESSTQQKAVLEEAIKEQNPLGLQVLSGSRGKPMNLASLLAADMLYSDHRDEVIPIPVLRSYSEGLSPEEYWAGTYGARRGIIATKFATQEAGFLSKQLNQAGHRLVVMGEDDETQADPHALVRGLVVDTADMDNEGALLARDTGPYVRNTPLTPKILKHLSRLGFRRTLVRSPLVGGSPEGGVYARDVGIRENGTLPGRGEQVGLQAAQALSEPISQGQLSAKHSGGVAGQEKAVGGFQYINQLLQVPKKLQGGAAHATVDGTVDRIEPAPAGGHYVTIAGQKHYVGEGFDLTVKEGADIEAGDMISAGIPNPAIITKYKGVGEGRRYFVNEFRKAMAASGMQGHRRNIELLARGLINHVKVTEETDQYAPDDVIPYSTLEHTYQPRQGYLQLAPKKAIGKYLERPVLHYTIGTKVRPSMLRDFDEFGVSTVPVHDTPPPFEPTMVRGMYQLQHDPDWMTQMYGSGLKESFLESTARGRTSELRGTSFVPSLAIGTDFGDVPDRAVIKPKAPYSLPSVVIPDIPDEIKSANVKPTPSATKPAIQATPSANAGISPAATVEEQSSNIMPPSSATTDIPLTPRALSSPVPQPQQQPVGSSSQRLPSTPKQTAQQAFSQPLQPTRRLATSRFDFSNSESASARTPAPVRGGEVGAPSAPSSTTAAASLSGNLLNAYSLADSAVTAARSGNSAIANQSVSGNLLNASSLADSAVTAARSGNSAIANQAVKFKPVATAAKQVSKLVPASTASSGLLSKAVGKAALPLALAAEGYSVYDNVKNKGWDATADQTAEKIRGILSFKDGLHTLWQAPLQVLSPVENLQMITSYVGRAPQLMKDLGTISTNLLHTGDPYGSDAHPELRQLKRD